MRKGLLLSVSGVLLAVQQQAYAACTPALDWQSLGVNIAALNVRDTALNAFLTRANIFAKSLVRTHLPKKVVTHNAKMWARWLAQETA